MTDAAPTVKCKKCGSVFQPDMKTKESWPCPHCQARNPNLKRHYRSFADLCIIGLIVTAIVAAVGYSKTGLNLWLVLSAGHGILLLVTIVFVYKSRTPWSDSTANTLILTVLALALFFNVVVPIVFAGRLNIPAIIVYTPVFSFFFWLRLQAGKCTAFGPSDVSTNEQS